MIDERELYIRQLLRNYKQDNYTCTNLYTVEYQFDDTKKHYHVFNHNEGIEHAIEYIKYLENKIQELEYVEKIIKIAKSMNDNNRVFRG